MTLLVPIRFFEQEVLRRRSLLYATQTTAILLIQLALLGACSWFFAGPWGVLLLIVWVLTRGVVRRPEQDELALGRLGARPLTTLEAPSLVAIVARLAKRAGLASPPDLYLLPDAAPNALAMGSPKRSSLGLTRGLLQCMDERELAGILAHEISHIRQRDTTLMRLADTTSQLTLMLARLGVAITLITLPLTALKLAPLSSIELLGLIFAAPISLILRQALSRVRELRADLEAVRLTQDPAALASALQRLEPSPPPLLSTLLRPHPPLQEALRSHPRAAIRIAQLSDFERAQQARLNQGAPRVLPSLTKPQHISSIG
jgi:heat shock protein HtpX